METDYIDDFFDAVYRNAIKWVHRWEKEYGRYADRSTSLAQAKASEVPSRFVVKLPYEELLKIFTETHETYREKRLATAKMKAIMDKVKLEFSLNKPLTGQGH